MTPVINPGDEKQKEFDLLPIGDVALIVDDATTKMSKNGNLMYSLKLRPYTLVGNYGTIFLYLPESSMLHMLLSFCEASGLSKGHTFPPELRSDSSIPNSFADIEVGMSQNIISRNMFERVVIGVVKHETKDGKTKAIININAEPPFKVYMVNGEPFKQPGLVDTSAPPLQSGQQTIAPPSDDVTVEPDIFIDDDGEQI